MILLDTNVVSALMRSEPDPIVVAWLEELPPESIWTTSVVPAWRAVPDTTGLRRVTKIYLF